MKDKGPLDLRLAGRTLMHTVAIGAAAGIVAAALFAVLELAQTWVMDGLAGYHILRAAGEMPDKAVGFAVARPWLLVVLPAIGALAGTAIARRFAPECQGAGENALIDAFHNGDGRIRARVIWVKPVSTLLTLATGGSGGREGPTAQVCGAIGSFVADRLQLSARERRVLLVAGSAAGVSAIFRTPLGAALLAVEVLYRDDFEADAMVPAALASVISYSAFISIHGEGTLFKTASSYPFVPAHLPLYGLMALLIAFVAVCFVWSIRTVERLSQRFPAWCRSALGGLVLGVCVTGILLFTHATTDMGLFGGGYGAAQLAIGGDGMLPAGSRGIQLLLLLCVGKLLTSSLTIGTGGSAGVFGPSLAIGALFGGAYGRTLELWLGNTQIQPGAFALVGMAAFYGGIGHAPLASLVMVCELAGSYDLLVPLMLAIGIAFVVLRRHTLYPAQVRSKHESPAHPKLSSALLRPVSDVLVHGRPYLSFGLRTGVAEITKALVDTDWQDVFPVLDEDGTLVGILSTESLRVIAGESEIAGWAVAADAMTPPVTLTAYDTLEAAAELMLEHKLRELPVVDEAGAILGFVDEADISRVYVEQMHARDVPA